MTDYKISEYSYKQAKKLGVEIKPSSNKNKKIDVFKDDKKITSIGASGYKDYPTYMKEDKELAKQKRENYKSRHKNNKGLAGFYASNILW
jgi:hypothetical protein